MNENRSDGKDMIVPDTDIQIIDKPDVTVINKEETERCTRMDVIEVINMADPGRSGLDSNYAEEKDIRGFLEMIQGYFMNYPREYDDDPDINEMNAYIRKLSYMLCSALKAGSELEANSAIAGISNGIELHSDLMTARKIYKSTYEQYMESCRKYMNCFISLTSISRRVDEVSREVSIYKTKLDEKEEQYNNTAGRIKNYITENKELFSEIKEFKDMTYNNSSELWSREMHELYNDLLSLRIQQFNIKYEKFQLDAGEKELHKYSTIREQILSSLRTKPSPDNMDHINIMASTYRDTLERAKKADSDFIRLFDKMKEMNDEMDNFRS